MRSRQEILQLIDGVASGRRTLATCLNQLSAETREISLMSGWYLVLHSAGFCLCQGAKTLSRIPGIAFSLSLAALSFSDTSRDYYAVRRRARK